MKDSLTARRLAWLIAGLALLPGLAVAAPIEIEFGPEKIEWFPNTNWLVGQLAIAGPECVHQQLNFRRGERIIFTPFDASGEPLPDGVYSFDLRLGHELRRRSVNEPIVESQLCRGREDLPPLSDLVSAGAVSILDARFVDPFIPEDNRLADGAVSDGAEGDGGHPVALGSPAHNGGTVLAGGAPVRSITAAATVLTNADGVIRNSLCVGFDCPNNPTFSDTTILLMENNTRIKFDDTSTLAGFPNRDWELQTNSNNSGGGSWFAVNDCGNSSQGGCAEDQVFLIEANAPANSIRVDDGGRVGFGTGSPVTELHSRSGDTPTLRLEQDSSSGFVPQTWDVAGNETNFFIRDATNGSTLPFRIQPGTASNTLFLASDEQVGIGTSSPEAPLEVQNAGTGLTLQLDAPGDVFFRQRNTTSGQFVDVNLIGDEFRVNFGTGGAGPELILQSDGDLIITGTYTPDYVFEPGYTLRSLDELAAFIEEHKHLPNVPSDAEVKRTRQVNVNEFQMRLLEKIEELTLYTLQQHATIGQQQETIGQLEARLARLENPETTETTAATER